MWETFINAVEVIAGPLTSLSIVLALLFGLLALFGLLWSPFAAAKCARTARGMGLPSSLFAWKGFAFSILYLFPWFYLMARIRGEEASRFWVGFAYWVVFYVWMVVGIIFVIVFIVGDLPRVLNPVHSGDENDLEALSYLMPAPVINAILWVVSLVSLIRRDRRDRENSAGTPALPTDPYTNPDAAAAEIIPARAYTNPFGFSLIGTVITLILFIISVGVRFSN